MWLSFFFFFKQKTAYEIKECDWSSAVCSSDLSTSLVFRGDITAGRVTWVSIGSGALNNGPHTDSRNMTVGRNGDVLEVTDGGISKYQTASGTWASLTPPNSAITLQTGEMVSVAEDPVTGRIFGSLWDNGIAIQSDPNSNLNSWNAVKLTDGGIVQTASTLVGGKKIPTYFFGFANVGSLIGLWTDKNADGVPVKDEVVYLSLSSVSDSQQPYTVNSVDSKRLLLGGKKLWEVTDLTRGREYLVSGDTWRDIDATAIQLAPLDRSFTALVYGAPGNPSLIYAGTDTGKGGGPLVFVRTGPDGNLKRSSLPDNPDVAGSTVVDIAVDPADWKTAYVVLANASAAAIYRTTDAGDKWVPITGNLIDKGSRTIEVVNIDVPNSAGRRAVLGTSILTTD